MELVTIWRIPSVELVTVPILASFPLFMIMNSLNLLVRKYRVL